MPHLFARVKLEWLPALQGGRENPFVGGRYAPTARLVDDPTAEIFSVVLQFDNPACSNPGEGRLGLLFPDLVDVRHRIATGVHLDIMEGARKVADCLVISAESAASEPVVHDRR